ncbi:MAG: DNA polymerase III subunit delta [Phycisphaeraceae bacterium]
MAAKKTTSKTSGGGGPVTFAGTERIVVLHGPEPYKRADYLQRLAKATAEATGHEVDVLTFDGAAVDLAMVLDELRSVGLMAQHKIIVVESADEFVKKYRDNLVRYAANPEPTATLVFRGETWNKGNLDKLIEKVGRIVPCEPVSKQQAITWINITAKTKHGRPISPAAAALLVDRLGTDLIRLDSELGKLAASGDSARPIDVAEVEQLVGRSSSESAWLLQEAILTGNPAIALDKVRELVELAGHHEQVLMIAASDMMRKIAHAAQLLAARQNEFAICKQLKIWPQDRQRPLINAARRLGTRRSAALLAQLTDLDARGKTGFGDPRNNIERFCVQFAQALR